MKSLLIIGSGPYGLTAAAQAQKAGIDFSAVGFPMSFWREHMPKGLILRTSKAEHFDVDSIHTMEAFMKECCVPEAEMSPLRLSRYLEYADWFTKKKHIHLHNTVVSSLDFSENRFVATLSGNKRLEAKKVIIAVGMRDARYIPEDLVKRVPAGKYSHSSDHSDLSVFKNKNVLVIGGRQSAFETAALLMEEGAHSVCVVSRHKTPDFTTCDFSFMKEMLVRIEKDRSWWRNLSNTEKDHWNHLAFREGRLKLEYWLQPRLKEGGVKIRELTNLRNVEHSAQTATLLAHFDTGKPAECDHIIFATGFKANLPNVACLKNGNVLPLIQQKDGSPSLDEGFQSSLKGLYFVGMFSMADFGFPFGFSTGAQTAAKIVVGAIQSNQAKNCHS